MTTSGPAMWYAARNTKNLPVNPDVSGMPAIDSNRIVITTATTGLLRASPDHCDRCVASPSASRTSISRPNAASVVKP